MLTPAQRAQYSTDGFFLLPGCLADDALASVRAASSACLEDAEDPGRVNEADGATPRVLHGGHLRNRVMAQLCRHPRLLGIAKVLIGEDVYVHQFKLSVKAAFVGDVWEWHQDFTFYHCEDELPEPAITTVALFLDDVTEFNAPLTIIPRSHREGFVESTKQSIPEYDATNPWLSNTTAKLRYSVALDKVRAMVDTYGLEAPKGRAGDAVVFHPNLFHCSGVNLSPFERKVIFISYNGVSNRPRPTRAPRPEFLAARNFEALEAWRDDALA